MAKLRLALLSLTLLPLMSGCAAVGATALAADVAVGTVGAAVGVAGDIAEGAVDVVTPGDDDDDN